MSVGIVIVNWNERDLTIQFLKSIDEKTEHSNYEVIVFDNNSDDGSVDAIRNRFPDTTVFEYDQNIGFVGGENEAVLQTEHDYYFLANNDCIVHTDGWLNKLVKTIESRESIGIVGPDNETEEATYHGAAYWDGQTVEYGPNEESHPKVVDNVSGAQFLIDNEVFETIGLIDETFWPAFYEELDFCWRAQEAGFEVVFEPRVLVEHLEGQTVDQDIEKYERNRKHDIRFRWLNYPLQKLLTDLPNTLKTSAYSVAYRDDGIQFQDKATERLKRELKAYWWNIKNIREIYEGRRVRREVLKTGDPHTNHWTKNRQFGD